MNIFEENSFSQKISNRKKIFMKELNEDYESNFLFSVKQVWIEFKNCVSHCKRISLPQNTASRVKSSVQNKGFGQWFMQFYSLLALEIRAKLNREKSPRTLFHKRTGKLG